LVSPVDRYERRRSPIVKDLKDKVVVITGAASGIGRALAIRLAAEGAKLALADKDRAGLDETGARCHGAAAVETMELNVARRQDMSTAASKVVASFGCVDVLVNNAGVSSSGLIYELTYETLEWTIEINLWGVIHGTKAFLPHLMARPEANLVNVSSVYGLIGFPGQAAYCASKFAVRGFTEAVRQDLRGTGVAVTVAFPGGVRTQIAKSSRVDSKLPQEEQQRLRQRAEQSLRTSPEDAAEAILGGIRRNAPRVLIGSDAHMVDLLVRIRPGRYDAAVARAAARLYS
jgi:NADP-dependent 3-hydroxy acid dehydrogenase YdfG